MCLPSCLFLIYANCVQGRRGASANKTLIYLERDKGKESLFVCVCCVLCIVYCVLCIVYCVLCIVYCVSCIVDCGSWIVYCVLWIVYGVLRIVYCVCLPAPTTNSLSRMFCCPHGTCASEEGPCVHTLT